MATEISDFKPSPFRVSPRRAAAFTRGTSEVWAPKPSKCHAVRYPWQMRNQNQNLGGSRARRWFGYLWHEWIGERWRPIAPAFARPNPAEWSDNRLTAAWLGHATVLINFFGIKILTDPVLFPRIGIRLPGLTVGPKRLTAPALTVRDLPKIDIVLLSHAHFDHL